MSPAASLITSPGTISFNGTSLGWPSRLTVAVTLIIAFSFAAAESARDSCTNRSETPRTTIAAITLPLFGWLVALLYFGFKNASGLAGPKLVGGFIGLVVVSEVVTKVALMIPH